MRIRVLQNFGGGITNERRVLPGDYDDTDERLCGAGAIAFMLETRAAVVIPDELAVTYEITLTRNPDAPDAETFAVEFPVTLEYSGGNARAHAVKVDGIEYDVPKADGDAPRTITVPAKHADDLLARGTFRVAEGEAG